MTLNDELGMPDIETPLSGAAAAGNSVIFGAFAALPEEERGPAPHHTSGLFKSAPPVSSEPSQMALMLKTNKPGRQRPSWETPGPDRYRSPPPPNPR